MAVFRIQFHLDMFGTRFLSVAVVQLPSNV